MESKYRVIDSEQYSYIGKSGDFVENKSSYPFRVVFSNDQPVVDEIRFHYFKGGESFKEDDNGSSMYARAHDNGRVCRLIVTEGDTTANIIKEENRKLRSDNEMLLREVRLLNMRFEEAHETHMGYEDLNEDKLL